MNNVDSTQTKNKRDLEPKMIRLRSEPIDLYKTEERNVAPHMKRPCSEPTNLNDFEQKFIEQKNRNYSTHTIRPTFKTNNYVLHNSH